MTVVEAATHAQTRRLVPSATHVALLGVALGVAGTALIVTSSVLARPGAYGLYVGNLVIGTFLVAFYWLQQRPNDRTGVLLLALGFANLGKVLQGASNGFLHTVGVTFEPIAVVIGFYVVFAFPHGRLTRRIDKILVGAIALTVTWKTIPPLLFAPARASRHQLGSCEGACPDNPFMIADRPDLGGPSKGSAYLATVLMIAVAVVLIARVFDTTSARRRMLLPVYAPALLLVFAIGVTQAALVGLVDPSSTADSVLSWSLIVARSTWAYGFLLALVFASVAAGEALKRMVVQLGPDASASRLRSVMADALGDPSLELGFRIATDGGEHSFVDSRGRWTDPAKPGPGRMTTPVEKDGQTVAVILHDDGLNRDPELVRAAGRVLQLAVHNDRLERDLESTVGELRASRARIASERDAERRRIERDLHDGAQQRIVALRIKLGRIGETVRDDPDQGAAMLEELGTDVEEVLEEVRSLAHGVYPPFLAERGLEETIRALGRRAPIATTVKVVGVERYAPEIESAVYFCCLEALQNVAKHALEARAVSVSLVATDTLDFEIRDDGPGFAQNRARPGAGFTNMRDRLDVVGGRLDIQSRPGAGTTLRGTIPLPTPVMRG